MSKFNCTAARAASTLAVLVSLITAPVHATEPAPVAQGEATPAGPIGDAAAGATKAAVCAACHGADGRAIQDDYPNLAGQNVGYTTKQLHDFKAGARNNALMAPMAAPLTDQDILDLAAHYATMPTIYGTAADEASRNRGEQIWRGGIADAGVPACTGCHGPAGKGNAPAGYPALAGQNAGYTTLQMNAFRSGERNNDPNSMMRSTAHRLSDAEIAAVSSFIAGLR